MIIGIDTGGTFTDFFWIDPENNHQLSVWKEPSTPENPSEAVIRGLQRIQTQYNTIVHGTTVATNAVLERKGAKVALLTTGGFTDAIEIGRQTRGDIYDINVDRPAPLVDRKDRFGIPERLDKNGEVLQSLGIPENLPEALKTGNYDAIAVCYLFSYVNPEHEKQTRIHLESADVNVCWSLSSEVIPEYREYERFSTTVMNAYVTPVMDTYLAALESELHAPTLRILQSNGGSMSVGKARKQSVQTLLSGPAGGAVAAKTVAGQCGLGNVVSFDMGGTSSDVSFIPGRLLMTGESNIDGLPVKTPMINIHTVGSGGGSIASRDAAGVLQVGPESAGADPGPVCYNNGGEQLTVTDANLLAGRLPEETIFGETILLNNEAAESVAGKLAEDMNIGVQTLAESILTIANARMERAIRVVSVEQGYDPADATLMAFGGAGPLHACAVAQSLGMEKILVPVHAGVFSALGLLWADVIREQTQTMIRRSPKIRWEEIEETLRTLDEEIRREISEQGIDEENITCEWSLEMRYRGQSYELSVPWQPDMIEAFHNRHQTRYTYHHRERAVEVVNLHVRGIGQVNKPTLPSEQLREAEVDSSEFPVQSVFVNGEQSECVVIPRNMLWPGAYGQGPCIVTEKTSTTFIASRWSFFVDQYGHLHLKNH